MFSNVDFEIFIPSVLDNSTISICTKEFALVHLLYFGTNTQRPTTQRQKPPMLQNGPITDLISYVLNTNWRISNDSVFLLCPQNLLCYQTNENEGQKRLVH